ncbi:WD40/YVTN/BNR-like repeat-containing protein, partial [candidate division KSB1 bacterium]
MKNIYSKTILTAVFFLIVSCNTNDEMNVSFELQASKSIANFRGVSAVDENTAWVSGLAGTFGRTIDGGKTWMFGTVPGANTIDFRDIHAFNENTAYLMSAGRPGKIYKTLDGGLNWIEQYSNDSPGIFLNAMAFWNSGNGIVVGDPIDGRFILLTTENGGETWITIDPENVPSADQGEAEFAASGTCLTVQGNINAWFVTGGSTTRIFITKDRGKTWKTVKTPLISGNSSQGTFSVSFYDDNNGVIVGGDYQNINDIEKNAAVTFDGGLTWALPDDGFQPSGFRECVSYIPGTKGKKLLTLGPSGSDISIDAGFTWTKIDT